MKKSDFCFCSLTPVMPIIMLVLGFLIFSSEPSFSQAGSLDMSFNPSDMGFAKGDGFNGYVNDVVELSDGSVIVGGSFSGFETVYTGGCVRVLSNGQLDNTFLGGIGISGNVNILKQQPDGKVLVGGDFTTVQGQTINYITRLLSTGTIDPSFNTSIGPNSVVQSIQILSDGKILIAGNFTAVNGASCGRIARLNSDGSLDASFNPGSGASGNVKTIQVLSDGKILVGGEFTSFNGVSCGRMVKLNANGSLDNSFSIGTGADYIVWRFAVQNDGKILVGGQFYTFNGIYTKCLVRLEANGNLDTAFTNAVAVNSAVTDIEIQADSKILAVGYFTQCGTGIACKRIVRFNTNGSIDNTFSNVGFNFGMLGISKLNNGHLLAFGGCTAYGIVGIKYLAKMDSNGNYLPWMTLANGPNEAVFSAVNLSNGKILVGGQFTSYNGVFTNQLVKLNSDGSIDNSFAHGSYFLYNGGAYDMIQTSSGNVIVAGSFSCSYGNSSGAQLMSITTNGTLNWIIPSSAWSTYYWGNNGVFSVKETSGGSLIIGGSFTSFNGIPVGAIAKLNSNGALDNAFANNTGSGFNNPVRDIEVLSNGKLLVVGAFTAFNGVIRNGVCLLNGDGTLDNSFNPGLGANGTINSCAVQSDGKFLIAGEFTMFNGQIKKYVVRLLSDGTIDNTFDVGSGPNGFVYKVDQQPSGRIVLLGSFNTINEESKNDIARLLIDGSNDASFNSGSGVVQPMTNMTFLPNGNILVGGFFTSYNGVGRNRIMSIDGSNCGLEICNGLDDDCDGQVDDGLNFVNYYNDWDGDSYGSGSAISACQSPGNGFVLNNTDCNDASFIVHPLAIELCDGLDNDCTSGIDNGLIFVNYYNDGDGDFYGAGDPVNACQSPGSSYVQSNSDCNDFSYYTHPTASEICGNGVDEDCSGNDLSCSVGGITDAIEFNNVVQYGTGVQASVSSNLATGTNSVESPGSGLDKWFRFTAMHNAVRIEVSGNLFIEDDNDITLYDMPITEGVELTPLVYEDEVVVGDQGGSMDAGNEVLYYDGLVIGSDYLFCVRNNNSTAGNVRVMISYLKASTIDILPFTNHTGIYNNTCQNFKAAYRSGASQYIVNRWASLEINGVPEWTYTIPIGTVCQLGKLVPANLNGTTSNIFVSVNCLYNVWDAYGNPLTVQAISNEVGTFQLAVESDLNVRSTDRCPVFKSPTSGSIATNRSICGANRYEWKLTQTMPSPSLPFLVQGAVGASRLLPMSFIPTIGAGQTYNVQVKANHLDGYSSTTFGTSACVRTLGTAGMPTVDEGGVIAERSENGVTTSIYPNPNNGTSVNFAVSGIEGDLNVRITDATGRMVYANRYIVEGSLNTTIEFGQSLAGGVYMVEMIQNGQMKTMRMVVSR